MDLFDGNLRPEGPEPFMHRYFKPILVGLALAMALLLTVTRSGRHVGLGAGEPSNAAQKDDKRPYDLAALRVFNNTLMRVNDSYVDPTRVEPKQMLLAALDQVQKSVAEVLVEPKPEANKVKVGVDTAQSEFAIGEVDSPWALSMKMREIFRFISQNLPPNTDAETVRNIEYAAVNGMLSTLDPHSMLLDPQMYNEMKLNTRGSFGGLGIVIGIRKGALTVIRPMPNTPAWNAGIKAKDRIIRIEKESTVNMMLNDAVSRLRGEPDTKVELWVEKAAEKNPVAKKIVLTRAVIQVKTVEAHMLENNIGYVKLYNSFGGNTADELRRAMDELKAKGMKGLVFDLRSNPGGLLDQAIKVADEFVDTGTIVTTVGYANKQREEKRATPGNQPHVPMAVLVNHGSASASEIVAGALKNLDRAVVIGTRTFGKGSVQVLYDNDDGSALKLTIAQYLTPGDVSIQSVGITPDVILEKVAVDKEKGVWLFKDYKGMSEAELESHLVSKNTRQGDKPFETIKFLASEPPKKIAKNPLRDDDKKDDPLDDENEEADDEELPPDEKFVQDYEIQFARDLVAQAHGWKRREVLASAKPYFDKKVAAENARTVEKLKTMAVDWAPVGQGQAPQLSASITTDKPNNEVAAGDTVKFKATITNKGPGVAGQVRAQLKGNDFLFDGREFVFGKIKPGESRTWTVSVKVPKDAISRTDPLRLEVLEEHGATAKLDDAVTLKVRGMPRPLFAYSYQLVDDVKGNGDGLVQRGESLRLHVTVKNIGQGKSNETLAQLRNLSDDGVYINKGRFNVDNLAPGETKSVDFTFDVKSEYKPDTFKVEMSVYDAILHEYVTDTLSFPVANPQAAEAASGFVKVTAEKVDVLAGATKDAQPVGNAAKDAVFKLTGMSGGFYRVELESGRPGYIVETAAQKTTATAAKTAAFTPKWQVSPPIITLAPAQEVVDTATLKLSGSAKDERVVADVYVFVSNRGAKIDRRKVFYRSNRKGATPQQMAFDANIPLWPGANIVTIVARENPQVQSQSTLIVERIGAGAVAEGSKSADNFRWNPTAPSAQKDQPTNPAAAR
jgi:carboxyl-terminal processing protease